jgi:environmental stress-induced protein Ves
MIGGGRLVRLDALTPQRWKNGGGVTSEIACFPPGADWKNFDWRVSRAIIEKDGAFSVFPGMLRWILLLEGNGFTLSFADREKLHVTERFAVESFPGDGITHCTLNGGPSVVLNVIARADMLMRVNVTTSRAPLPSLGHALIAEAGVSVRLDEQTVLHAATGIR